MLFISLGRNEMFRDWEMMHVLCVCLLCSEKRVGNVYSKAKSFVDYVRRALRRLELDESKVRSRILRSTCNTVPKRTVENPLKEHCRRHAHHFGTIRGKMFPRWWLFRKYSNSCQVSKLQRCLFCWVRVLPGTRLLRSLSSGCPRYPWE